MRVGGGQGAGLAERAEQPERHPPPGGHGVGADRRDVDLGGPLDVLAADERGDLSIVDDHVGDQAADVPFIDGTIPVGLAHQRQRLAEVGEGTLQRVERRRVDVVVTGI